MKTAMKRLSVGLITLASILAFGERASADLILNGSFEQASVDPGSSFVTLAGGSAAITGWTVTGDSVDYIGGYWQPSDGARSLDLSGNNAGGIQQILSTAIGSTYSVLFDLAGNPAGPPTIKTVEVSAGAQVQDYTFDTTATSLSAMGWKTMTFQFTATSSTTTLAFASLDATPFGPALDNVRASLVSTPEPSTIALAVSALPVALVVWWRRRKRAA
jgi:choice-of-anchor C domain-containing protein